MTDDLNRLRAVAEAAMPGYVYPEESNADATEARLRLRFRNTFHPAVVLALLDRAERAETERDELRHNWAHDVSTLEALIVQDEAAFRRLRKAYEDLVETATTKRLAEVRVELDGAYDLLREAAKRDEARADLAALRAAVTNLADEWQTEGITCECGHYVGTDHNSLGCYGVVTYTPLVRCSCKLTDNQDADDIAAARLRSLLAVAPTETEGENT